MSSNISGPLPKKYDNPSITVIKNSGDLDETENSLVSTTDTVVKLGNTYMGTKPYVLKEAITPPIAKNKIYTVNKTEKSQACNKTVDKSSSNKSDKGNKVNKSRFISRNRLSNKSTKIEKTSEIDICK